LKSHLRITIVTVISCGASHREIERRAGVERKTIRRYAHLSNSPGVATGSDPGSGQTPPPRPPALDEATTPVRPGPSACADAGYARPPVGARISPRLLGRSLPFAPGWAPGLVAEEHLRSMREDRVHPSASQASFSGS
jgi:hypothetical protein